MTYPLPSGWQEVKLGDITKILAGGTPSTKNKEYWNGNILWLTSGELNNKKIYTTKTKITEKGLENSNTRIIPIESILIGLAGQGKTRGTVAINYVELCTNQSVASILPNEYFIQKYLYYQLDMRYKELRSLSYGDGGRGGLNLKILNNLIVKVPPLEEQKRIAEVLSLCDDIIENLTELIEKKEQYKKGVMQRLLSGEVRFKGFTDEWKTVRLGDLATITSAGVDKKINTDEKKVRLLNYLDVFNRNKLYDNEISFITSANDTQIEKCNIKKGDLFITPSSEDREGIAKSAVAMEDFDNVVYSYHIIRLRFNKEIDLKFKSYMCDTELFHRQAYRLCDGSGQRYVISLGTFREMKIYIPTSIEEQRKIGEFLSTIDNEIDNLKKQLELRKQQKKGLMQRLLTGKVRI